MSELKMSELKKSELNSKLRWLIAIRMLIVVSLGLVYLLYHVSAADESLSFIQVTDSGATLTLVAKVLLNIFGLTSLQTLVYIACLRVLRDRPRLHAYLQFSGDLLLVTAMIDWLGAAGNSYSILYFMVISVASVLLRRSAGIVVATLASLCFALITFYSPLPWPDFVTSQLVRVARSDVDLRLLAYNLAVHLTGFYVVAILTAYLARDVTRAEERLRASNLDLAYLEVVHRDVVQSITSGLVTTDLAGIVTSINQSGESIVERSADDLVGLHVAETGLFDQGRWRELTEPTARGGSKRTEVERRQGAKASFIGLSVHPLRDPDHVHRGYILVLEDLTAQRHLQAELRTKDRMAAIGEMAAGLAHEVGNPLAAISGSVQMLAGTSAADGPQRKLLEILLKESRRLDRTVKSFLQLAGSRERQVEDVDIAALVAEDVELLRLSDDVHEGHRIEVDLDPPSAVIRADPDQIGQIFWNLARNALRAMPGDGRLEIAGRLAGPVYRLSFRDSGNGMSEEEKTDLFHPFKSFFDQGTGLGMAIVYRIVEEHGGMIRAESEPGKGTTIEVELRVAGPSVEQAGAAVQALEEKA